MALDNCTPYKFEERHDENSHAELHSGSESWSQKECTPFFPGAGAPPLELKSFLRPVLNVESRPHFAGSEAYHRQFRDYYR